MMSRACAGGCLAAALFVQSGFAQAPAPVTAPGGQAAPAGQTAPAAPAAAAAPAGRGAQVQQPPLDQALLSCPQLSTALRGVAQQDTRARDWTYWGALTRYAPANATAGKSDVVFMGDSITDNWDNNGFGGFFPGKNYIDRGIGGQTTPQMLLRFRPDVTDLKPKVVVILAGTNDIAGNTGATTDAQIEGNLQSMAELSAAAGIKVVFSSITPVAAYHVMPNGVPQTTQRPMTRIKAINDWMKSYAAAHKGVYLDYFSALVDDKGLMRAELTTDDLHPTADGYKIMTPLAEAAIARALAQK